MSETFASIWTGRLSPPFVTDGMYPDLASESLTVLFPENGDENMVIHTELHRGNAAYGAFYDSRGESPAEIIPDCPSMHGQLYMGKRQADFVLRDYGSFVILCHDPAYFSCESSSPCHHMDGAAIREGFYAKQCLVCTPALASDLLLDAASADGLFSGSVSRFISKNRSRIVSDLGHIIADIRPDEDIKQFLSFHGKYVMLIRSKDRCPDESAGYKRKGRDGSLSVNDIRHAELKDTRSGFAGLVRSLAKKGRIIPETDIICIDAGFLSYITIRHGYLGKGEGGNRIHDALCHQKARDAFGRTGRVLK